MNRILAAVSLSLLAVGCQKDPGGFGGISKMTTDVVYLETNDYHDNANAVLAYQKNADGTLSPLPGSPFKTGGAGIGNPTQGLGPDDSDDQIKITSDGKFLLAVNPGSNTIAVFRILENGALAPVDGSPFYSEGQSPVSIAIRSNQVYVANQATKDSLNPAFAAPNYVSFLIDGSGALTYVTGSKFETSPGSSPSQIIVSNDNRYAFGADFLGFMLKPAVGTLRSFSITGAGKFMPVAGTPYAVPSGMGGALGLSKNPKADILYVGFPVAGKVGVYKIGLNGSLAFQSAVDAGAAACWLRTTKSGNALYALNSGENTVSVFNTWSAASPVSVQKFALKHPGPLYGMPGMMFTTSEDFGLAFSPDENTLYVISQYTNKDLTLGNYNLLHTLKVATDGTLTEPGEPLEIPVDASVRPQGIAVKTATFLTASLPSYQKK